jgi:hypothetical protein
MHVMRANDPAFQWETEAQRPQPEPRPTTGRPTTSEPDASWVTLREAHEATDIPIETLRKWARRGAVRSALEETEYGERRMIDLGDVRTRARHLGRELKPAPARPRRNDPLPTPEPAPATGDDSAGALNDDQHAHADVEHAAPVAAPDTAAVVAPAGPPSGTMIVPIDAWDKMLLQLGNLHEAGQQLAEARERAAKAETEARFLRERLAELRAQRAAPPAVPAAAVAALDTVTDTAPDTPPESSSTEVADEPATPPRMGEPWARVFRAYAAERWRERRRQ